MGNSRNTGTNWSVAWTNFASIKWASVQPGDTVWISGGATRKIYRENLVIGKSGTNTNGVITVKNATHSGHDGQAVIDGGDPVLKWDKCSSAAEARGNTNWQHLYKTTIASLPNPQVLWTALTKEYGPMAANLWQGTQALKCARSPTSLNAAYLTLREVTNVFYAVPATNVSNTSLADPRLETLGGANLVNAFLLVWGQPNQVYPRRITAYNPASHTVSFEDVHLLSSGASVHTDRDTRYAIVNDLGRTLSQPGEFYLDPYTNSSGTYDLFVWPLDDQDPAATANIDFATRSSGVNFGGNSFITIDSLTIRNFANSAIAGAGSSSKRCTNLTIKNCEVSGGIAAGYGLFYLGYSDRVLIESNYIHDTRWSQRGVTLFGSTQATVNSNRFERIAGSAIYFGGGVEGTITANTLTDCLGVHANAITIYGPNCTNFVVERNFIQNSTSPLTISECTDATYRNNIVNGGGEFTFNKWAKCYGTLAFYNNTFVGNTANNALSFTPNTNLMVIAKNNILDGGDGGNKALRAHNLWVGLTGYQKDASWRWGEGELVYTNLDDLFVNPAGHDYRLKPGSPAIGAGTNLSAIFTNDFAASLRGDPWDIGAFLHVSLPNESPLLSAPRRLRVAD